MTNILPCPRNRARHLFLGSAGIALATLLASPGARAQAANVRSTASQAVVSSQAERDAINISDGSDALVTLGSPGPVTGETATLSDNAVRATTRGNEAMLSLSPDGAGVAPGIRPTHLAAGPDGITADAGSVIAASQRNQSTVNGALLDGSRVALEAGAVSAGVLAVERNSQETIALGNDSSASLTLARGNGGGAGITSLQSADGAIEEADDTSPVGAHSYSQTALGASAVSGSMLSVTGNLERAIGYGNATANDLSVEAVSIDPPVGGASASIVPGLAGGDTRIDAGYGVLSSQYLGAAVKARAGQSDTGPAFAARLTGGLTGSSLANDGNTLAAGGYGNQSANRLEIGAGSIAPASGGGNRDAGAIANVTGVQRLGDDGRVIASTYGGAVTEIAANVDASTVSGSRSAIQTLAVGNRADGNLLSVKADSIDTARGTYSGGVVGSALVGADGTATTTAALGVQNVQDSGDVAISAGQLAGRTDLTLGGALRGSAATADANAASVAATRNQATNSVTIAATDMRTSADLNSFQVGSGSLVAVLGSVAMPGGATIAVSGPVTGSSLSVSGNSLATGATGNNAANTLSVTGAAIADDSGHDDAEAGLFGDSIGAAATFALASQQQLGVPESGIATPVVSQVAGRFAASAEDAEQSSFAVDGNTQQSTALGNGVVNRLAITATDLGGDQLPAPGSALSSLQFGSAAISATSFMDVAATGAGGKSSVSLTGNANQASAAINQADNGLSVAAVTAEGVSGGTRPGQALLGAENAVGDHVLANWQVATGRSDAVAATRLLAGEAGALNGSEVSIRENATSADAAANRALNKVSLAIVSGDAPAAGLLSNQRSSADVSAMATTNAALIGTGTAGLADARGTSALNGNTTTSLARGNSADNALMLSGTGRPDPMPVSVHAGPGATAQAGTALLNVQVNAGAISSNAAGTSYATPLNAGTAATMGSSLGVTGNSVSAEAYGNAANNVISIASPGGIPGNALVNSQVNSGPVSAQVTGASYRLLSGSGAGMLSITGNQISATAIGNQVISAITGSR